MRLTAALVIAAGIAALNGEQKFTSRVDSVRLDALVLRDGAPLLGLTADDFEVRDNGAPQKVTILAAGALPLDVILTLDVSSSLAPERLAALRRATQALLAALQPVDRAALATFSHRVLRHQELTGRFDLVRQALDGVEPAGATSLVDAMYTALSLVEPANRRSLLIVFSDGIDTTSWLRPEAVVGAAQRSEVVVYAVSTSGPRLTPELLHDVTEATGGKVFEVDSKTLAQAFVKILDEFRHRYLLSYSLPTAPSPGWHRIEVRVKRRGASVKSRSGYHVVAK
jgi:VWFA-related protein